MRRLLPGFQKLLALATCAGLFVAGSQWVLPGGPLLSSARAITDETTKNPRTSIDAVKKELTAVIEGQLTAFRADDYAKAYEFAASGVRNMFPPVDFAAMVKAGYPLIAHSVKAEYGITFDTGEKAVVNVHIEDAAKRTGDFQYVLEKEDGAWKIAGVAELKAADLSI